MLFSCVYILCVFERLYAKALKAIVYIQLDMVGNMYLIRKTLWLFRLNGSILRNSKGNAAGFLI